ncbi:MAG: hypothetical protein JKX97_04125, partial [Candidatus Lindowbacteria bacterium]|nr:hypothetical protein [Candidatus Lindowbacteria bacterium]
SPTNSNERILKDDDLSGILDPSLLQTKDKSKMSSAQRKKSARAKARAKFANKWEASTNRSDCFDATGNRKKGIQQILNDVDQGSRNDLKPKIQELGMKLIIEFPWEASLLVKQIDEMPKGKLLRVFRTAGPDFDGFITAYDAETYSGYWVPTHRFELVFIIVIFLLFGGGLLFGLRYIL